MTNPDFPRLHVLIDRWCLERGSHLDPFHKAVIASYEVITPEEAGAELDPDQFWVETYVPLSELKALCGRMVDAGFPAPAAPPERRSDGD